MRNPFKDHNSADDWFRKLWTAEIPKSNDCLYGNTGTDMLYNSLCPKSPELSDIIERADKRFGLGETLKSLFALLYLKEPQRNENGGFLEQPLIDGVIKNDDFPKLKRLCEGKKLPAFSAVCAFAESTVQLLDMPCLKKATDISAVIDMLKEQLKGIADRIKNERNADKRLFLINCLFKKKKQIQDLERKLSEESIKIAAEIADSVSSAADKALKAAEQTSAVLRSATATRQAAILRLMRLCLTRYGGTKPLKRFP